MSNLIKTAKTNIQKILEKTLKKAKEKGEITYSKIPSFIVEFPREKSHGDFATNIAMLLPKEAKMPPAKIADIIIENIDTEGTLIEKVEKAGPGFINFHMKKDWLNEAVEIIEKNKENFGKSEIGKGKKIQVEFVSANPTGPMHMGNARGAALGDSLANTLKAAGYEVKKEFYINDAGNQIENFGLSLEARYLELLGRESQIPENGYHGEDIKNHMKEFIELKGDQYLKIDSQKRRKAFIDYALNKNLDKMKEDLKEFGVEFDVWYSEQSLYDKGEIESTIKGLKEKEMVYEKEGAYWLKASELGAEKDEVVIRQNGIPTYFAADIAYHKDKFERGFDTVINIWGADHHGHVPRMKGAVKALGYDPEQLHIIIMQLVRLLSKGEAKRMSKRQGTVVTLSDLISEVGKDAARFFFNLRSADTHLEFDLDLAVSQSSENPVFYVQYAHARICSILRTLEENGVKIPTEKDADTSHLQKEEELQLIRKLADFPGEIEKSAKNFEPYHLTKYSIDLATQFHAFYNSCRVLVEDKDLMKSRILLIKSVKQVLKNTFSILGISAPDRM